MTDHSSIQQMLDSLRFLKRKPPILPAQTLFSGLYQAYQWFCELNPSDLDNVF